MIFLLLYKYVHTTTFGYDSTMYIANENKGRKGSGRLQRISCKNTVVHRRGSILIVSYVVYDDGLRYCTFSFDLKVKHQLLRTFTTIRGPPPPPAGPIAQDPSLELSGLVGDSLKDQDTGFNLPHNLMLAPMSHAGR